MKKTIQEIIDYLEGETGGENFAGDCGSDFDKAECDLAMGEYCSSCRVAFYKWERRRMQLGRIKEAFKEEA